MSFTRTWMKLETIILSKLIQEQKTKHLMISLMGEHEWELNNGTHGQREGNITHQGLLGMGGRGGIALGEIPHVDNKIMDACSAQVP